MIRGNAQVTCLNPDDTIFIDDITEGDRWYFPTGYPHSIQGPWPGRLRVPSGLRRRRILRVRDFPHLRLGRSHPAGCSLKELQAARVGFRKTAERGAVSFPGTVPGSLEDDRKAVGGKAAASEARPLPQRSHTRSTCRRRSQASATRVAMSHIINSNVFAASKNIAAALVRVKPGALPRASLAPQRLRVAVLDQRLRTHDGLRSRCKSSHRKLHCQ